MTLHATTTTDYHFRRFLRLSPIILVLICFLNWLSQKMKISHFSIHFNQRFFFSYFHMPKLSIITRVFSFLLNSSFNSVLGLSENRSTDNLEESSSSSQFVKFYSKFLSFIFHLKICFNCSDDFSFGLHEMRGGFANREKVWILKKFHWYQIGILDL